MHKEVYWKRQHGGVVGEERLTLPGAGSRQDGRLPASFQLWAAHRGKLCLSEPWARCQTPLFLQVIHTRHFGHQVAGRLVLLPVLHLACPAEGEAALRALESHPSLGAKQPSTHPSGSWGRADTAQH